jgi:hypothetical protein
MSEKKTQPEGSTIDPKSPDEQGHILGIVMDRSGDTRYDGEQNPLLTVGAAIALAREEMGRGKWLRTVDKEGNSDIIRDIKDIADDNVARGIFEDVSEMEMMAALVGG